MLGIVAAFCFLLAALNVNIGNVQLGWLGLLFLALEIVFEWRPWRRG